MDIDFFKPVVGNNGLFGVWKVNGKLFYRKRDALLYASANDSPEVTWEFYDSIWDSFDKTRLGKQSLKELYKQRAQQLRDKYDYLILAYSGGSDSHNVLMSFLSNNIKIDQIFVSFPFKYINSDKHTPNSIDKTPENLQSEWNLCVKPTLEYLAKHHPDVKVDYGDWMNLLTPEFFKEDTYLKTAWTGTAAQMARFLNYSEMGMKEVDKGRKVATIWGFEKPFVGMNDKRQVFMFFNDQAMLLTTNSVGAFEPFYWTTDLPDLPYEMAYQQYLYFKTTPIMQRFLFGKHSRFPHRLLLEVHREIIWDTCYSDTWDKRKFQTGKTNAPMRTDRDFFIFKSHEFDPALQVWQYHFDDFWTGVDTKYMLPGFGQAKTINSKGFYLGDLDPEVG
jgi:hypothetical protein